MTLREILDHLYFAVKVTILIPEDYGKKMPVTKPSYQLTEEEKDSCCEYWYLYIENEEVELEVSLYGSKP